MNPKQGTIVRSLAQYAVNLEYDDLPYEVIHQAKRCVLDLVGCGLGARGMGVGQQLLEWSLHNGSYSQATLWGDGRKTTTAWAALSNGTIAHHLEFDDGQLDSNLHAGITTIPAAIATAENTQASGRGLLTSIVAGYDVAGAVGRVLAPGESRHKLHGPGFLGSLGAATTVGKLLSFDEERLTRALSLAGCLLPISPYEAALRGSEAKDFYGGWPNMLGILAAEFAGIGAGGPETLVEGTRGIGQCLLGRPIDEHQREEVLDNLGQRYEILHTYFKPYASSRAPHPSLTALQSLIDEEDLSVDLIETIDVETYPYAVELSEECDTDNEICARWDIPYNLSALLLWGDVPPHRFKEESRNNSELKKIMKKVRIRVGDGYIDPVVRGAQVSVTTKDGGHFEAECLATAWDKSSPPQDYELEEKFSSLASLLLSNDCIRELLSVLWDLENCDDIAKLTTLLGGKH